MIEPVMLSLKDVLKFKYCPICGGPFIYTHVGDYMGSIQCHNDDCDAEIDFELIAELKQRLPERFKEWGEKL